MGPEAYTVFLTFALVIPITLAVLRFLVQREKKKALSDWISDGFFALALMLHTCIASLLIHKTAIEIRLRAETSDEETLFMAFSTPKFLKVSAVSRVFFFARNMSVVNGELSARFSLMLT